MRDGRCPKCGSCEVFVSHGSGGVWTAPEYKRFYVWTDSYEHRDDGRFYVCAECGYVEQYLTDPQVLAAIAASATGRTWSKVIPPGWFPDPAGRHESRYWDGIEWTSAVRDRDGDSVDPHPL
ncbi:MAG: DUF2510 domain-containing protein [Coriobacteriia bacterium]|nr:DUF2510 domain-containing protein [Coriobacteriia bacterium]